MKRLGQGGVATLAPLLGEGRCYARAPSSVRGVATLAPLLT